MTDANYIFDTDHLSLYGRANPSLIARLQKTKLKLTTTVINVEEQLRGRLAQISEIKDGENKSTAYQLFTDAILMLSEFDILQYDAKSREVYQSLKVQRIRAGTQDLRIASIVIANDGILLKIMFTKEDMKKAWLVQEFMEEAKAEGKAEGLIE